MGKKFFQFKAIETHFDGYHFRSRLEARWAVFFKHLGLDYHYEPEGYALNGTPYLPDFWLPSLDSFIEIKGEKPSDEEVQKAWLLSLYTEKNVFIISGNIGFSDGTPSHSICLYTPPSFYAFKTEEREGRNYRTNHRFLSVRPEILFLLQQLHSIRIRPYRVDGRILLAQDEYCHVGINENKLVESARKQYEILPTLIESLQHYEDELAAAFDVEEGWHIGFEQQFSVDELEWVECVRCHAIDIGLAGNVHTHCEYENTVTNNNTPRLLAAYEAARSARF